MSAFSKNRGYFRDLKSPHFHRNRGVLRPENQRIRAVFFTLQNADMYFLKTFVSAGTPAIHIPLKAFTNCAQKGQERGLKVTQYAA